MRLQIKNFAAIRAADIQFDGITVIAGENDAFGKPTSIVGDFSKIPQTLEMALEGKQLQPLLL